MLLLLGDDPRRALQIDKHLPAHFCLLTILDHKRSKRAGKSCSSWVDMAGTWKYSMIG